MFPRGGAPLMEVPLRVLPATHRARHTPRCGSAGRSAATSSHSPGASFPPDTHPLPAQRLLWGQRDRDGPACSPHCLQTPPKQRVQGPPPNGQTQPRGHELRAEKCPISLQTRLHSRGRCLRAAPPRTAAVPAPLPPCRPAEMHFYAGLVAERYPVPSFS